MNETLQSWRDTLADPDRLAVLLADPSQGAGLLACALALGLLCTATRVAPAAATGLAAAALAVPLATAGGEQPWAVPLLALQAIAFLAGLVVAQARSIRRAQAAGLEALALRCEAWLDALDRRARIVDRLVSETRREQQRDDAGAGRGAG